MKFKVGDKVKCIDAEFMLNKLAVVDVTESTGRYISIYWCTPISKTETGGIFSVSKFVKVSLNKQLEFSFMDE